MNTSTEVLPDLSHQAPEVRLEQIPESSSNETWKREQKVLLEHEKAVQKLTELQKGMIGGEKVGMPVQHVAYLFVHVYKIGFDVHIGNLS